MYWQKKTRISVIADAMSRDMFSVIIASLKVFDESLLNAAQRKSDRFHKIRPLIDCVRSRCLELDRPQYVSVDEMIIPFTGRTHLKQFTPRKPNPHGLKIFVLASSDGQVLDFEFFQGKEDLLLNVQRTGLHLPEWGTLKIGEAAVLRFVKSVSRGTSFFFDRFFATPKLLEILSSLGMGATGTMKKNLVPKQCRLKTENQLKRSGRGSSDCAVRDDSAFCITVCMDFKLEIAYSLISEEVLNDDNSESEISEEHDDISRKEQGPFPLLQSVLTVHAICLMHYPLMPLE
ncbi:piggyBac transposable element-derived protein 3-like [Penaeus monodon]|uniref:piggyBac transposable element-derived protein 3-like n=1 Tax=Penaeus monodon TaxID=6687 RepID=UPI0018A7B098|nr:piggyBac transposable element-derived protein 3-like [Penaeus monodon]